jgi:hypothetical protein
MALYNAKRAGRNCTRVLLDSIDEGNPARIDLFNSAIIR